MIAHRIVLLNSPSFTALSFLGILKVCRDTEQVRVNKTGEYSTVQWLGFHVGKVELQSNVSEFDVVSCSSFANSVVRTGQMLLLQT